MYKKRSVESS